MVRCTEALDTCLQNYESHVQSEYVAPVGRVMCGSALSSSLLKGDERVESLLYVGDSIFTRTESLQSGQLRSGLNSSLDYGKPGLLENQPCRMEVRKTLYGKKEAYQSSISSSDNSLLWNEYYERSEQIPTFTSFLSQLGSDGKVQLSCGILVQGLVSKDNITPSENLDNFQEKYLKNGVKLETLQEPLHGGEWLAQVLGDDDRFIVKEREHITDSDLSTIRPVTYFCPCSVQGFVKQIVTSNLNIDELYEGEESLDVSCDYCNKVHKVLKSSFEKT